jgi:DNA-binding CsgD family transcriptional regulator
MNSHLPRPAALAAISEAAVQDAQAEHATETTPLIEIAGMPCRLLLVDDVVPHHSVVRKHTRPRLIYVEGEFAHFELGGHRYALVVAPTVTPDVAAPAQDMVPADVHTLLTNRELQIVQLICMGFLTKQVADRLQLSQFTVRSYLKTVYYKLGVRSRGAMVYRYAQAFRQSP